MDRPISVYRFPRRALTLCPELCMGIQGDARFPARSADALPATLYGHFTHAINLLHSPRHEVDDSLNSRGVRFQCGELRGHKMPVSIWKTTLSIWNMTLS